MSEMFRAWKLVSQYVRMKAANEFGFVNCATCSASDHWKKMDAGHCMSKEINPGIYYNTLAIAPQCKKCNRLNDGMYDEFKKYIIAVRGIAVWEYLRTVARLAPPEPEEVIEYYKLLVRELKKKIS